MLINAGCLNQQGRSSVFAFVLSAGLVFTCLGLLNNALANTNRSVTSRALEAVRVWPSEKKTRIVLEFDRSFQYQVFELNNPPRLVVDIKNAQWRSVKLPDGLSGSPLKKIRHGKQPGNTLRVVMDLKSPVQRTDYVLDPSAHYGHRLVIDVRDDGRSNSYSDARPALAGLKPNARQKAVVKPDVRSNVRSKTEARAMKTRLSEHFRDVVVAIDPGHGGEDPGALGKKGLKEKHVVLQISKLLKQHIDREPGMRGVLTRDGDYFVGLAKRRVLAKNKHQADIFVSIHADAWKRPEAHGASVYVLSRRGASSALAGYLAQKENAVDAIGGAQVAKQDEMLRNVLADLAMEGSLEHSFRVAEYVIDELSEVTHMHKSSVEQAGFMVLKSLDIPSILVETGFISNPGEEKKLANKRHQERLANGLFHAIKKYFNALPPPDTYFAALQGNWPSQHKINAGETLSEIAMKYRTSTTQLKQLNRLNSDRIYVGTVLRLPQPNDALK